MKSNLKSIFDSLHPTPTKKLNDHILIIDALNTFIRNFATVNFINQQGNHIGGLAGFLKSLGYLVRTHSPTRVLLVFDGKGSTINRKNIDPDYKKNRNLTKITNWDIHESKEAERESMADQIHRLIQYLQCLPVQIVMIDKIEADDVIAFISKLYSEYGKKATIVSSDKDFLQVVDKNISVYSPTKKKTYTVELVKEEYNVLPKNFLLYKTLVGDQSDNLPGVNKIGPKTVLKLFPDFISKEYTITEMFNICENHFQKNKKYLDILQQRNRVEVNYKIMNLIELDLSDNEIFQIKAILEENITPLNTLAFEMIYQADNMNATVSPNILSWLEVFRYLTTLRK